MLLQQIIRSVVHTIDTNMSRQFVIVLAVLMLVALATAKNNKKGKNWSTQQWTNSHLFT